MCFETEKLLYLVIDKYYMNLYNNYYVLKRNVKIYRKCLNQARRNTQEAEEAPLLRV